MLRVVELLVVVVVVVVVVVDDDAARAGAGEKVRSATPLLAETAARACLPPTHRHAQAHCHLGTAAERTSQIFCMICICMCWTEHHAAHAARHQWLDAMR